MQTHYAERFEREQGSTEADWLRCLPGAVREHRLDLPAPGQARIQIGGGQLLLRWLALPDRQIALMRMPRLVATYHFEAVPEDQRQSFMRYFDLFMLRGGG